MFTRIATNQGESIEQRYHMDFVREMAPNLQTFVQPYRELIKCPITGFARLAVTYQKLQNFADITTSITATIWQDVISGEEVNLVQLSSCNANPTVLWVFDYDEALCTAADWLQAALLAEGYVYVPKKIPPAWYTEQGQQDGNDSDAFGINPTMEGRGNSATDDGNRLATKRAYYRANQA